MARKRHGGIVGECREAIAVLTYLEVKGTMYGIAPEIQANPVYQELLAEKQAARPFGPARVVECYVLDEEKDLDFYLTTAPDMV